MNAVLKPQFTDLLGNGQTLKQFRDDILERTANTGHYDGLTKLELRESDPIKYEKLFSKLRGGLVHARETAKKIAASPIVEQEGELCFTLYNAAGDCVLTSTASDDKNIFHLGRFLLVVSYKYYRRHCIIRIFGFCINVACIFKEQHL